MNLLKVFILLTIFVNALFSNNTELEKISLRLQWKHQFEFAGFYAAKEKGFYKKAGLDVKILEYENGIDTFDEVISGKVEFGVWGSGIVEQYLRGRPVVMLANYLKKSPLAILTQPEIKLPSDLVGKKFMVSKVDTKSVNYLQLLKSFNVDFKDIEVIPPSYNIQDFIDKKVDAVSIFTSNELYTIEKEGIPYNILNPSDLGVNYYDLNLFTSREFSQKYPELTKKFTEASNKGWKYAIENTQEIVDLIYNKYNKTLNKTYEHLQFEAKEIKKMMLLKSFEIGSVDRFNIEFLGASMTNIENRKKSEYYDKLFFDEKKDTVVLTKEEKKFLQNNPVISIGMISDFAQFSFIDKNKYEGFEHDLLKIISNNTGILFEKKLDNWSNIYNEFKNNKLDAITSISYNKERTTFTLFTEPYYEVPIVLYTRDDFENYNGLTSLKNKKVGLLKNIFYDKEIKKIDGLTIEYFDSNEDLAKGLFIGQVDAIIQNFLILDYVVKSNHYTNFKLVDEITLPNVKKEDLRIGINSSKPELESIIQKGLNNITYAQMNELLEKWLGKKLPKKIQLNKEESTYLLNKPKITLCLDSDEDIENNIEYDFIKLIEKKLNTKIVINKLNSLNKRFKSVRNNNCDLYAFEDRDLTEAMELNISKPLYEEPNVIITKDNYTFISDFNSLEKFTVALPKGTKIEKWLKNDFPNIKIKTYENELECYNAVENEKADITIRPYISAIEILRENNLFDLKISGQLQNYFTKFVFAFRNNDVVLESIINKAIDQISEKEKQEIKNNRITVKYEQVIEFEFLFELILLFVVILGALVLRQITLARHNREMYNSHRLFEKSPVGLAMIDFYTGKFLEVNQALLDSTGYEKDELLNLTFWDITPNKYEEQEKELFKELEDTGQFTPKEKEYIKKDGTLYPIRIQGFLTQNKDNKKAVWGIIEDITELNDTKAQLVLSKEKAEHANRVKSYFLANMSHEIRTPMNGILGLSKLLLKSELNFKQKDNVKKIINSTSILLKIINDILDISKVEEGKLELLKEQFSLPKLLDDIKTLFEYQASEKGLNLEIICEENLGKTFLGDSLKINQILTNLVGNAIKFTEAGSVIIKIENANDNYLRFKVVDTGIGIRNDQLDEVFDSFSQADIGTSRKFGGTGLGLSITKKFVELMNGKIWVESRVRYGSKFIFEIELEKISDEDLFEEIEKIEAQNENVNLEEEIKTLKGSKILLVEDNKVNQDIVIDLLEHSGIEIDIAVNGVDAIVKFDMKKDVYELILMDIQMPILDGYKASKTIREKGNDIPIIALTANAMKSDELKSKSMGMNEHLTKPIDLDELYKVLLKYIPKKVDKKELEPEKKAMQNQIKNDFSKLKTIDPIEGLKSLGNNEKVYLKVLNNFLIDNENLVFERLSKEELKIKVHTLKGLSKNIGANHFHKMLKEYETSQDKELLNECQKTLDEILDDFRKNLPKKDLDKSFTKKKAINVEKQIELLSELKEAIELMEPNKCSKILEEIDKYKFFNEIEEKLDSIKLHLENYDFDEALEIFQRLNGKG